MNQAREERDDAYAVSMMRRKRPVVGAPTHFHMQRYIGIPERGLINRNEHSENFADPIINYDRLRRFTPVAYRGWSNKHFN